MVNPPGEAQEKIASNDGGWKPSLKMIFDIATRMTYESDPKHEVKIERKEYDRIYGVMIDAEVEGDEYMSFLDGLYGSEAKLTREVFLEEVVKDKSTNWIFDAEKIRNRF